MIEIKLSSKEIRLGVVAGGDRQIERLEKGFTPTNGESNETAWQRHVEGILGEMALCKFLNIYWKGPGQINDPDVGLMDVRTAARPDSRLIVHYKDPDERIIWFLTGVNGVYIIRGWIYAVDGKQYRFWCDPTKQGRPAFFVPQFMLNPVESFDREKDFLLLQNCEMVKGINDHAKI